VKKETATPTTPAPSTAAPANVAPAAKVEPAPAPAAVKPEAKPVAVLSEADGLALAKKNGCLVCHAIDKKVVGPAWKDVAAKYRGDTGAEARLMAKIAKGGSGVWGSMAMPANPKISEADRQALAKFVLSLK
jgi:cytochrome c